jgi:hypothetical protein
MRGVTQSWIDVSALRVVRKEEHEAVMLDGINAESDWMLAEAITTGVGGVNTEVLTPSFDNP